MAAADGVRIPDVKPLDPPALTPPATRPHASSFSPAGALLRTETL
jgi:hypothetical protein